MNLTIDVAGRRVRLDPRERDFVQNPYPAYHAIRAAVAAMQTVFRRILAEGGIAGVEKDIAAVADVFALQGDARMRELEKAFLR